MFGRWTRREVLGGLLGAIFGAVAARAAKAVPPASVPCVPPATDSGWPAPEIPVTASMPSPVTCTYDAGGVTGRDGAYTYTVASLDGSLSEQGPGRIATYTYDATRK